MKYAVIIPTYNRGKDLKKCLDALYNQVDKDFEIIIVNGGEQLKSISEVKVINQHRKGLSEARNLGWMNTDADVVCFIDDDLIVSPTWFKHIKETFENYSYVGGVSGPTLIPKSNEGGRDLMNFISSDNFIFQAYRRIILEDKLLEVGKILKSGTFSPGSNFQNCLYLKGLVSVDYLEACHMCFRRSALIETGGFDYAYTGTGEWAEPDLSFKVKKLGYALVFNPKAVAEHHISQGGVYSNRTYAYERSKNFINFYYKWRRPNWRFYCNLFFINVYWIYKFIETKNWNWLTGLAGTWRGLWTIR